MAHPEIHLTDAAAAAVRAALGDSDRRGLRIAIDEAFQYDLRLDDPAAGDAAVDANGITVIVDAASAPRASGLTLDFDAAAPEGGAFSIDNPNAPREIVQISPGELAALLQGDEPVDLLDVRTPGERALARIEGSRLLDQALHDDLMQGDRSRPLVFQCHHGVRSQSAAEHFRRAGFTRLYNLRGGIDAWSLEVDPKVPRY